MKLDICGYGENQNIGVFMINGSGSFIPAEKLKEKNLGSDGSKKVKIGKICVKK